jgi:uncharacterized protein YeaO (DUF488 family)
MVIRIVRLGSARVDGEGTRIGTVRRPPRGVPKSEFATLSHHASFSVGCYCETEARCHRSALRALLVDKGAAVE